MRRLYDDHFRQSLAHIPSSETLVTSRGMALFDTHPTLQGVVAEYAVANQHAEDVFRDSGLQFVGCGDNSEVWQAAGMAIKLSTPTTGRDAHSRGMRVTPENLVGQLTFMHVLGRRLKDTTGGDICTPDQYFALRTPSGNHLSAQQYMASWIPWSTWLLGNRPTSRERTAMQDHVKGRILAAIGGSVLRLGVADLGLSRYRPLHGNNILVPATTTCPAEAPLCIIDQPSATCRGRLGIMAAKVTTSAHGVWPLVPRRT